MSPNIENGLEKNTHEYFDNPGYIEGDLENPKSIQIENDEYNDGQYHHVPEENEYVSSKVVTPRVTPKVRVRKRAQIFAAIAANMGAFALGAVLAWSATALPSLRESSGIGEISKSSESWIGSIVTLGAVAACPLAGFSMVQYGRRRTMLLLTAPFVFGWILIAFAESLATYIYPIISVYIGRVLTGFCGGAFTIITPVFIAESAHVKIRGGLSAGFDLMLSFGMLYIYIIGAFTDYKVQAISCAVIPVVCHILMCIVPESPRYLVEMGRMEEAFAALKWFFGLNPEETTNQLNLLTISVTESQARPVNFRKVVMKMSVLKPILICVAILFFYTMSAVDAIIFYAVDIFESTGSGIDPKHSTIILGAVQVVATIPAAFIVDKCGRRLLLMISQLFMSISLVVMGLFFYLVEVEDKEKSEALHAELGWLPLIALNVFIVAYSLGIGPLALMMMGELVPSHIKGMTSCGVLMIRWLLGFGVTNLFETLENGVGVDFTYWIFGFICFIGVIFVWFCVPETKGKSLDEIQVGFISKDKLRPSLTPLSRAFSVHSVGSVNLTITSTIKA